MQNRSARIRRIAAVQAQLHRLAEWRLIELQRREDELQTRQRDLVAALNGEDGLQGLFVEARARRLAAAGAETGLVAQAREKQAGHVFAEARRLKQARLMAETATRTEARSRDQRTLETVIDTSVARSIGQAWFGAEFDPKG